MTDSADTADAAELPTCPYCGNENPVLVHVDAGMRLALTQMAISKVPESVCDGCHSQFIALVSKGAKLRTESRTKQNNRLALWRNRVAMVKKAKLLMSAKRFADAAAAYEKYLRALEIVYDRKSGELTPDLFKNDARKQEITVITSVYWDLMRVYDSNSRFAERQMVAAKKLAEFARFSPVFHFIIRKAHSQTRTARNPAAYKLLIKQSNAARPRCFIASAAYDGESPEVTALCAFRDQRLMLSRAGRAFVRLYYVASPPIANAIDCVPFCKPAIRAVIRPLAKFAATLTPTSP